jgi:hypothetical protein
LAWQRRSIDGSLQYGDLRALLKVPSDVPSILDLPTDRVQESDLRDVMWRDPAGIDILLAPPRVEMAEMVTRARRREDGLAAASALRGDRHRHADHALGGNTGLARRPTSSSRS